MATAVAPGALVGITIGDAGAAIVIGDEPAEFIVLESLAARLTELDAHGPRWVWWSGSTARRLIGLGIRPSRCWDLTVAHRLLVGGWRSNAATVWAVANGLDPEAVPTVQAVDLFNQAVDDGAADEPILPSGHLRPEWVTGGWRSSPERIADWCVLAMRVQRLQHELVTQVATDVNPGAPRPSGHLLATIRSESAAEVLCAELEHDGLPLDRTIGEQIVADFIGPRPTSAADEVERLRALDATVLAHLPAGMSADLRSPDQVKTLLRRVGIEVPDTRAWRLEALRDAHPIVEPLLAWRRAERIRTTFGYVWLDEHVGDDGRLRGSWSSSDGAAGRMTATAGLHNMPAELRPAILARPGRVFVRADLGQIEPRVLAAISGDRKLATATQDDDMYAPVASQLRVEREIAKVAVLGAMYGQTTGRGAEALHRLEREYPVAMGYLRAADEAAQGGNDLRTYGGRLVRMSGSVSSAMSDRDARSRAAARGRYGRNAMVQGAAAEFFKTWAVLVRARGADLDASIVLCLHDELVVDTHVDHADAVVALLDRCLHEAAARWAPSADPVVRFVAETSVIERWSDAK